jgi:PAS domain S-box-containing protein
VEISLSLINYHAKDALLSVARNITKRKKAEQDILEEKAKAERYLDIVGNMVLVLDSQGKITLLNRKGYDILGYLEGELNGKSWIDTCLPKEMREEHRKLFESLVQGKAKTLTQYENPIVTKQGELRLISWNITELRNKTGQIVGTLSSGEDITEHKKTEEQLEKNQLGMRVINKKLQVIGELTRHDARNKLSVIMMQAYMLKQKYGDNADILDRLRKIEMASESIEKIFDFAKIYEQLGSEKLSFVAVGKAVDEAVSLFPDLTIKVINDCNGLTVLADSLLKRLFYNLLDNTIKHGKKATKIRVFFEQAESNNLHLIYDDDGVGISAENKLKLFYEGFSTGGSSGFGLFLICKMMDVYGWQIQEVGEPGKGAKFVITILKKNWKQE